MVYHAEWDTASTTSATLIKLWIVNILYKTAMRAWSVFNYQMERF